MASLSLSESKYTKRAGRAKILAELMASGHTLTLLHGGTSVKIVAVIIKGKQVDVSAVDEIAAALNQNINITLIGADKQAYALSAFDKAGVFRTNSVGFNKGDVAEGIFALALAARFTHKNDHIDANKLNDLRAKLKRRDNLHSYLTIESKNANPTIIDTVHLVINLAKVNLDALFDSKNLFDIEKAVTSACLDYCNAEDIEDVSRLLYMNNRKNGIFVAADGIGDQTGTKVDVTVKVTAGGGVEKTFGQKISLKAGDVKQFGQVGGSEFSKQAKLFSQFGIKFTTIDEQKYNTLMLKKGPYAALDYSYSKAVNDFNKMSNKGLHIKQAIVKNMVGNDPDTVLVRLNQTAHVFDPKTLSFSNNIQAILEIGTSTGDNKNKLPKIRFVMTVGGMQYLLLTLRTKVDNGSYIRNYIEKGKDLHSLAVKH